MDRFSSAWPTELRLKNGGALLGVVFDNGAAFELPAEYLRVESPSAEVRGHSPSERKTVAGKSNVKVRQLVPTGNYAVRIVFDDGHETGIYTWSFLHELGAERQKRWAAYLAEIAQKGLSR